MTTPRLSRLQKRILSKLMADERRTKGGLSSSHPELVQALPHAKGNISHSLRRLEAQGLIFMGRTPGAKPSTYTSRQRAKNGPLNLH